MRYSGLQKPDPTPRMMLRIHFRVCSDYTTPMFTSHYEDFDVRETTEERWWKSQAQPVISRKIREHGIWYRSRFIPPWSIKYAEITSVVRAVEDADVA